mgnify:CR=1 FL=1
MCSSRVTMKKAIFQSTLPVRGATLTHHPLKLRQRISIHAPRAGSDENYFYVFGGKDISIHAPRAGSDV